MKQGQKRDNADNSSNREHTLSKVLNESRRKSGSSGLQINPALHATILSDTFYFIPSFRLCFHPPV